MSVFDSLGGFVSTTPIPGLFQAIAPLDSTIVGTFTTAFYQPGTRPEHPPLQWVEIRLSDSNTRRMDLPHPLEIGLQTHGRGTATGWGARSPEGDYWFDLHPGEQDRGSVKNELVQFGADGSVKNVVIAGGFHEEYRTEREIEEWRANPPDFMGGSYPEEMVQNYINSPRPYGISGRNKLFDDLGRLWIATQRQEDGNSIIDLYESGGFIGSLRVRDRVLGFDVMGSTLVVLVERSVLDAEGLPLRAIDWYAIR